LNFITLPFNQTGIHDCNIDTVPISSFDASMPNLETRDATNRNIGEKKMLLDAFPTSFCPFTLLALCGQPEMPELPAGISKYVLVPQFRTRICARSSPSLRNSVASD
jgi:hypothetical protein